MSHLDSSDRASSRVASRGPAWRGFVAGAFCALFVVGSVAATRYDDLALFTSVLTLVRGNYVEDIDERKLLRGALKGMVSELDPHSAFMDIEAYAEMQVDTSGEFQGLGIEITKRQTDFIEVVSPIEGTPAERAGLRAKDQITEICPTEKPEDWTEECASTKAMSLVEAVQLMRGKRGTSLTIHVWREGFEEPRPFEITRDVVKIVSVDGRMLEPGYGYVRVRAFQERTALDLREELARLHKETPEGFRGLVIDLRDNPGGLLDQAVKVSDIWLSDGLVVYTEGRDRAQRQEYRARVGGDELDYPLVVLVNEGSASASEIVAGALRDQDRALVVGASTFGKGSVQTVYPLDGGAGLRLTTALYFTPGGHSIQEVGIEPDIVIEQEELAEADDSGRKRVRERDLEGHFQHEDGEAGESDAAERDVQLERALEVLKSWTYFEKLRQRRDAKAPMHAGAR